MCNPPNLVAGRQTRSLFPLLLNLLLALWFGGQYVSAEPSSGGRVIHSVGEFWTEANDAASADSEYDLDIVVDVLYYDAHWNVLWVRGEGDKGSFFPVREGLPLSMGSDQRVRVQGTIIPREGLDPSRISVELIRAGILTPVEPKSLVQSELGDRHLSWMAMRGFVDRQSSDDEYHITLDLIVDGQRVTTHIFKNPNEDTSDFTGRFVQATGIFTDNTMADESGGLGFWVPGLAWLEKADQYGESVFGRPSQMISEIAALPEDRLIRITGLVFAHEPGRELVLRDETGQVILQTPQLSRLESGELVDVIGYPETQQFPPSLRSAVYRSVSATEQTVRSREGADRNTEVLTRIRLVRQVLRMDQSALAARPTVQLVGTISYVSLARDFLYLHDGSGGIQVVFDTPIHPSVKPGLRLEIGGNTESGSFAPQVRAMSMNILGDVDLPTPRNVSLEQATSGMESGQWIRLEGYLRAVQAVDERSVLLSLVTPNGDFEALVQSPEIAIDPGSTLLVTGVCFLAVGPGQQMPTVRMLVADLDQIGVQAPALARPFDLPLTSIENLQNYRPDAALHRPMKTRGTVIHHVPGRALWIDDGTHVLHALSDVETVPLIPGQVIEIVGLPGRLGSQFVLREARFRLVESESIAPMVIELETTQVEPELHGRLVRHVGELVNVANTGRSWVLYIRSEDTVIPVKVFPDTYSDPADGAVYVNPFERFEIGSTLAVTGLYQVVRDESGRPISFEMMARSFADLALVEAAPWLNSARTQQGAIGVLFFALLGASWMLVLQRRVARQRKLIQQQMVEESFQRRHYQDLVDQAKEFIFTLDLEGNFTSFNKSGELMTGLTHEEALTKKIYDIIDQKAARRTRLYIKHRLNHARSVTFEYQLRRSDGVSLDVETSAGFILRDGEIVGGYGIMRDISQRKQDEAERRAFEARAQQSKKLEGLGTLASGIAHDFNNILTSINGAVDVSRLEKSAEARQELFDQIGVSADRAKQLVRQILAFSRNHPSERRPIDLRGPAKEVYTMLRSSLPATVELNLEMPDQPLVVRANPTEIHQIIMNIATNAWSALSDQRGHVSLLLDTYTAGAEDAESDGLVAGDYARIRIRDDGSGMTPAVLDRIFEPFFSTKGDGEGTGLGLAAVHGIVQSNAGVIRVESEPNHGSVFSVFLPQCNEAPEVKGGKDADELPLGAGQTILLIDDDKMVSLILEKTLRKLNYTPLRYTDPVKAKAYFDEAPARIGAVLSDLSMPELTGRDLAEHMLKVRPDLPFIIQSGHIKENLDQDLLKLGVHHVFSKPVPIKPLATVLAEIFTP